MDVQKNLWLGWGFWVGGGMAPALDPSATLRAKGGSYDDVSTPRRRPKAAPTKARGRSKGAEATGAFWWLLGG